MEDKEMCEAFDKEWKEHGMYLWNSESTLKSFAKEIWQACWQARQGEIDELMENLDYAHIPTGGKQ